MNLSLNTSFACKWLRPMDGNANGPTSNETHNTSTNTNNPDRPGQLALELVTGLRSDAPQVVVGAERGSRDREIARTRSHGPISSTRPPSPTVLYYCTIMLTK